MRRERFQGRRLPDAVSRDPDGRFHPDQSVEVRPGDFWKVRLEGPEPENGWWVYVPDGRPMRIEGFLIHEHGNGTITAKLPVVDPKVGLTWSLRWGEWFPT